MNFDYIQKHRTKIEKVYVASGSIWTTPGGSDDGGICLLRADRNEVNTAPHERDCNVHFAAMAINHYLEHLKIYQPSNLKEKFNEKRHKICGRNKFSSI